MLVSFYNLVSDPNASSLEDNKIKSDVNNLRSIITTTNYKTRFIIVLVADGPINVSDLEERLVNIRRGTNFDSKALYFLPSTSSRNEINDFAKVLLSTLHPTAIEYYRDLSKHARRKRSRNVVPQPTLPPTQGTSSVLTSQGWNVRYEFKLAVFAEQRQEMEAACRNYEAAYEGLFSGELIESIPSWSTRFNDARMLADTIAIRIIRCFLWSAQSAAAVKWWSKHKERMQDLIDRRGKGTATYGWQAWCGMWSKIMAELIEKAEIFPIAARRVAPGDVLPVQLLPEREAAAMERQAPWEHLHHEGYWLSNLSKHIETRRQFAMQIAPEDRALEQNSNAASNKRAHMYENYLVPDPAREYSMLTIPEVGYTKRFCESIDGAIQSFQARSQRRMIELLELRLSGEHVQAKSWSKAVEKLRPVWYETSWREQGWWSLLSQVGTLLLSTAIELEDHEMCLRLAWELAGLRGQQQLTLEKLSSAGPISTAVDLRVCLPQLTPTFAFAAETGHVGEPIAVQLSLACAAGTLPLDLQLSELKVVFDGGINPIILTSSGISTTEPDSPRTSITNIQLSESDAESVMRSKRLSMTGPAVFSGQADLSFRNKGTKVLNLEIVPREAGQVSVSSIVLLVTNGTQEVALDARDLALDEGIWWELRNGSPIPRVFGCHREITTMTVLPKPPKIEIKIPNLAKAYYTNENVELELEIVNGEDEAAEAEIEARIISPARGNVQISWKHNNRPVSLNDAEIKEAVLPTMKMDSLASKDIQAYSLLITGLDESVDHEVELKVSYTLTSNPSDTLVKQVTIDIPVIRPFEATTIFQPRYHSETWPDFFAPPEISEPNQASGLKQQYLAKADIGCFAQEALYIRSLTLNARRIVGGASFTASTGKLLTSTSATDEIDATTGVQIQSDKTDQFAFDVELQKIILGDRSPVTLDCAVDINWSRIGSDAINTSTLPLAKFLAPMSEPRVLLRASEVAERSGTYLLTYTIENPSMHFLTFNIAMTGGEDIAFSGSKLKTVSLVPISRYDLRYRIFTQKRKEWVKVHLDVLDAVFQQHLKIQPVSDNVRADKQGVVQLRVEG